MDRGLKFRLFLIFVLTIALVLAFAYRDADLSSLKKYFNSERKSEPPSPSSVTSADTISFRGMHAKVLLDENFGSNLNKWYEVSDDKASYHVGDSSYLMKYYGSKSYLAWLECGYSAGDTIVIQSVIDVVGGAKSHSFGLMWNSRDGSNTNYFVVNRQGEYILGKYDADEGDSRILEGNVQLTGGTVDNRYEFEIRRAGNMVDISVNGAIVVSGVEVGRYFGSGTGFILIKDMEVRARSLKVIKYSK